MSENYFTGQFSSQKCTSQNKCDENCDNNSKCCKNQNSCCNQTQQDFKKQMQNMNINSKNQQNQSNKQEKDYVNLQEVIVEKQDIQEQKFIESNAQIAVEQKKLGNEKYGQKQYRQALGFYRKCLQYTDKVSEQDKKFRSVIYSNIGLTYMKMQQDSNAIQYFQNSLKLNQTYTKARTNLAQCYENTQKIEEALDQYNKVLQQTPNDFYLKQKVYVLQPKVKQLQEKRKDEVVSGLKNIGNSILGYFGMSLDNFKLEKGPGGGYNIQMKN